MTDKMREDFEAWARKECSATDSDLRQNQYGYVWSEWKRAFKAYQAATLAERAAVQPLTDAQIDAVTNAQWGARGDKPIYAAHRAFARAIEAATKAQAVPAGMCLLQAPAAG